MQSLSVAERVQMQETRTRHSSLVLFFILLAIISFVSLPMVISAQGPDGHLIYYVSATGDCGAGEPCYQDIQDAVRAVDRSGETVKVAGGTYDVLHDNGLFPPDWFRYIVSIDKDLSLLGGYSTVDWEVADPAVNRTVIDGGGLARCINVEEATVVISGFEVTNGDATGFYGSTGDAGGGIYARDANLTLEDCSVYGNIASHDAFAPSTGGGMYAENGAYIIDSCVFSDNVAHSAYAGTGGAISLAYCDTPAILRDCVLTNNRASDTHNGSGGALSAFVTHAVLDTNDLTGNAATRDGLGKGGAALFESCVVTMTNNTLDANEAGSAASGDGSLGGAVYASKSSLDLQDNVFEQNVAESGLDATGRGGSIYAQSTSGDHTLISRDNEFREGVGSSAGEGHGGAIWVRGISADLAGNTFEGNRAGATSGYGGAVMIGPDYGGGAASTIVFTDNWVVANIAATQDGMGGGVYAGAESLGSGQTQITASVVVQGNTIWNNTASEDGSGYGGGLALGPGTGMARVVENSICFNTASINGNARGGGIHQSAEGAPTFTGNTIMGNVAADSGMTSYGYGGGVYLADVEPTLSMNTIVDNSTGSGFFGFGGGIYGDGVSLYAVNNIIAGNSASYQGSGLNLVGSTVADMIYSTIADNDGDGLHVDLDTVVSLTNSIVSDHSIAGVVASEGCTATLQSTLWHENGADWSGGGDLHSADDYEGDPDYLLPAIGNYHISADSAAIDKGVDAGIDTDIDGDLRPYDSGYDLGADERREAYLAMLPVVWKP